MNIQNTAGKIMVPREIVVAPTKSRKIPKFGKDKATKRDAPNKALRTITRLMPKSKRLN